MLLPLCSSEKDNYLRALRLTGETSFPLRESLPYLLQHAGYDLYWIPSLLCLGAFTLSIGVVALALLLFATPGLEFSMMGMFQPAITTACRGLTVFQVVLGLK